MTDFPTERDRAADEECFELNGCFTGDCPHSSIHDCGKHFFKAGADWARTEMQAEISVMRDTVKAALKTATIYRDWREQALKLRAVLVEIRSWCNEPDHPDCHIAECRLAKQALAEFEKGREHDQTK